MKLKKIKKINLIGYTCPITLLYLRKYLYDMKKNEKILIISDDITTIRDIPKLCNFMNYILIKKKIKNIPYKYILKKK
ncbi:sulfurtransferase TusA family protein [Buchnera aphidicola]|uniref:sulfurtransferase TusA family protein n=1 Tax=Buchnera aphidicola TaxID=9 RepID=UPI0030ECF061